ncbi:MAG: hypothetical protein IKS37_02415 [Solobacterium sp.]|jgi:hypothetical protein|nr:hypothetical protein [Solobacterium sp.]
MAEEEITRATPKKPSTGRKKTGTTTSSSRRKTTSSTAKKKPATTAKKKTTSSSSIRLTKEEKTLVTNFRKCNMIEKKVITLLTAKLSDSITRTAEENDQLTGILTRLTGE